MRNKTSIANINRDCGEIPTKKALEILELYICFRCHYHHYNSLVKYLVAVCVCVCVIF